MKRLQYRSEADPGGRADGSNLPQRQSAVPGTERPLDRRVRQVRLGFGLGWKAADESMMSEKRGVRH